MNQKPTVSFLHALFGLPVNPIGTSQRLIAADYPPYSFSLILCTLFTIFVPIITQIHFLRIDAFRADLFYSLVIVIFFSMIVFSVVEVFILQLLGIHIRWGQMIATIAYSMSPITFALLVVYCYNYSVNGSLTLITLLLTGYSPVSPSVLDLIAVAFTYCQFVSFLIFASCVKEIGHGHWISATVVTLITAIPFYLCVVVGLALSELAVPGTIKTVYEIAPWVERLLNIVR